MKRMLNVGLGGEANETAIAGAERFEGVFAAVGRHPTEAAGFDDAEAERIAALAARREGAGDRRDRDRLLPRDAPTPAEQRRAFEAQIEIAGEAGLPIVIHARDPEGETAAIDEIFELARRARRPERR